MVNPSLKITEESRICGKDCETGFGIRIALTARSSIAVIRDTPPEQDASTAGAHRNPVSTPARESIREAFDWPFCSEPLPKGAALAVFIGNLPTMSGLSGIYPQMAASKGFSCHDKAFGVALELPCEPAVGADDRVIACFSGPADCTEFPGFRQLLLNSMNQDQNAPEGRVRQGSRLHRKQQQG